ncbi:MAG TPA: hypothetical protein VGX50_12120, partial [Longimicrobium sp.]|nr:hypothetical protein [Longimicrobium sp.]
WLQNPQSQTKRRPQPAVQLTRQSALADGLKNRSSVRLAAIVSLGWRWNFTGPILAGDRISATIRVISKRTTRRPERGLVTLYFDLRNQRGETVQHGENDMMVHRRSE